MMKATCFLDTMYNGGDRYDEKGVWYGMITYRGVENIIKDIIASQSYATPRDNVSCHNH